ncbi:6562_t:CDS:2 [Cetraspora pellucida]|uniref:6562_t:CDS:1 n=1 Tax=Cetraspora pellucida TaxID=1433469 RepID=A0ACA9KCE1_9GLOM|nr:6562_t:CDS:2 [Cetraspora pellucida]
MTVSRSSTRESRVLSPTFRQTPNPELDWDFAVTLTPMKDVIICESAPLDITLFG